MQIYVQPLCFFPIPLLTILFISSVIFFKSINSQFHLQFKEFKLLNKFPKSILYSEKYNVTFLTYQTGENLCTTFLQNIVLL